MKDKSQDRQKQVTEKRGYKERRKLHTHTLLNIFREIKGIRIY